MEADESESLGNRLGPAARRAFRGEHPGRQDAARAGGSEQARLDVAHLTAHAWIGGVTPASKHDIITSQDPHGGPGGEDFG